MKHLRLFEQFTNESKEARSQFKALKKNDRIRYMGMDHMVIANDGAVVRIVDVDPDSGKEGRVYDINFNQFRKQGELLEAKPAGAPDFHDSKAPDAHGKFRDLSIEDLAKWLIDTRNGDVKKISGSLTQQIVFNRNDNPEYAEKMEKTRQEVYKQLGREDLMEAKAKPGPDKYMTGLDDKEEEKKEDQIKKQREMDDDDSDAYKEMPGDKEAREEGKVKTSKHVKKYHELYGDDKNEALSDYEDDDADYDELYKDYPYKDKKKRRRNEAVVTEANKIACLECDEVNSVKAWKKNSDVCPSCNDSTNGVSESELVGEFTVNEEKAEGDRSPLDNADIEKALKKKSEETGVPIGLIRIIMRRGMAAWKTGHRPGAGQEQWGYARVNAFLTKGKGTWGGADKDVAKEVRDGGHDSKLKS